jgi:hypothetical protein
MLIAMISYLAISFLFLLMAVIYCVITSTVKTKLPSCGRVLRLFTLLFLMPPVYRQIIMILALVLFVLTVVGGDLFSVIGINHILRL